VAKIEEKDLDFLRAQPERLIEEARDVRMAENVLSSYTRAADLLAETLQNATDAIDERTASESGAPRRIEVVVDRSQRLFSVTDTGLGISPKELEVVLAPNVTYKSGQHNKNPNRRSRGEKGVGLSFLVFACDRFELETADGSRRQHALVRDANRWIDTEGQTGRPREKVSVFDDVTERLRSTRYTTVTVAEIAEETFDDDLFTMGVDELIWLMRTQTAVGDTSSVFATLGRELAAPIKVELVIVDRDGVRGVPVPVQNAYALPEEFLDPSMIVDWADVESLSPAEQLSALSGQALRYLRREVTRGGRVVDVYFLVVDGRQMADTLKARKEKGKFAPADWTGLWLATRGMPANVALKEEIITPRTYARRTFALLQFDELKLDLGRKTVASRVRQMLNEVAKSSWEGIADAAERVQRGTESGAGKALLDQRLRRAEKAPALGAEIPYLKVPANAAGVASVFHELISSRRDLLPSMHTLRTGVFEDGDELVYPGEPNGVPPRLVLYGFSLKDISRRLQRDERLMETAELVVVWEIGAEPGVEVAEGGAVGPWATHEMLLYKVIERLPVIALEDFIERSGATPR
jgi:molecular chaperone HtpG